MLESVIEVIAKQNNHVQKPSSMLSPLGLDIVTYLTGLLGSFSSPKAWAELWISHLISLLAGILLFQRVDAFTR